MLAMITLQYVPLTCSRMLMVVMAALRVRPAKVDQNPPFHSTPLGIGIPRNPIDYSTDNQWLFFFLIFSSYFGS